MQTPIVDLHCHLLPGIDDGPATMEESLAMARMAVDNGITHAVVTPHLHPGRWENTLSTALPVFARVQVELRKAGIPLELALACEARLDPELLDHLEKNELPFLGEYDQKKYMLLELPHGHIPIGTDRFAAKLLNMGIQPVIAHPERNKDAMRSRDVLRVFEDMGCLFQLTAGSLMGKFGQAAKDLAAGLLESPATHLIASDAHNTKVRIPELINAKDRAAQIIGEKAAMALISENPWRIASSHFKADKTQGSAGASQTASEGTSMRDRAPALRVYESRTPLQKTPETTRTQPNLGTLRGPLDVKVRVDFIRRLAQHLPAEALDTLAEQFTGLARTKQPLPSDATDKAAER